MLVTVPVRTCNMSIFNIMRTRSRPKTTWIDVNRKDMIKWSVMGKMACKKTYWNKRIHVGAPNLWDEMFVIVVVKSQVPSILFLSKQIFFLAVYLYIFLWHLSSP